jgi:hypothetical protein
MKCTNLPIKEMTMNRRLCLSLLVVCLFGSLYAETYVAGTTYSYTLHNGGCGRTIEVDRTGRVNVVWTRMTHFSYNSPRHVYYNLWNPFQHRWTFLQDTAAIGASISDDTRSGFATLALTRSGWCLPAYNTARGTANSHAAVAMDFEQGMGAFAQSQPSLYLDNGTPITVSWPKISADISDQVHLVAAELPVPDGHPYRLFYARGSVTFDSLGFGAAVMWQTLNNGQQLEPFDSSDVVAHDIVCSSRSLRVARAWIRPGNGIMNDSSHFSRDVFIQISEDGGVTWGAPRNLTRFIQPLTDCPDPVQNETCCNRDTLSAFQDLSLLFDHHDVLHIAFTTVGYRYWQRGIANIVSYFPNKATIWHWSEELPNIDRVVSEWVDDRNFNPSALMPLHAMIEHPSLSVDSITGRLFCSYVRHDTSARSSAGYYNADVFVAFSETNGAWWWVGTNVTNTRPIPPAGQGLNRNEQDATLSTWSTPDQLHLFYLLDVCGDVITNNDQAHVLNSVVYQPVPVTDLYRNFRFAESLTHVDTLPCGPAASTPEDAVLLPASFSLSAFPNPFNATVNIRYSLPAVSPLRLSVYDLLGREVAMVLHGLQVAGPHEIRFDGSQLASGIYLLRLTAGTAQTQQKIVLLK